MNKKLYLQLLLFPIILMILSSILITSYNVYSFIQDEKKHIENITNKYIEEEKRKIYTKVHLTVTKAKMHNILVDKQLKKQIKNKVDYTLVTIQKLYKLYKNKLDEKQMKEMIINYIKSVPFEDKDGFFFVHNLDNNTAILHKLKEFKGKDLTNKIDLKGTNLLLSKKEILKKQKNGYQTVYVKKPSDEKNIYPKIVYFTKFKPYNWLIGTGKYIDTQKQEMLTLMLSRISFTEKENDGDLFISQIYDINGGKNSVKNLYSKDDPMRIGKFMNINKNQHRQRVLKALKQNGEYFGKYTYIKENKTKSYIKYSYCYYYKPWNILIGSGFYMDKLNKQIDDIKQQGIDRIKNEIIGIVVVNILILSLMIIISYIISTKINKIIQKNDEEINDLNNTLNQKVEIQINLLRQKDMLLAQKSKARSLGDLLAIIAHQWRQPLSNINSITSIIYKDCISNQLEEEKTKENISNIEKLTTYMSKTISDFTAFYKPSNRKITFNINDMIQSTIDIVFTKYFQGNKPKIIFDNNIDVSMYGYKSQFQQILLSILNNSIENFQINNIKNSEIKIQIQTKNKRIFISIEDNGGGIQDEYIEKIFDLHFTTKNNNKSLGIGLYMAKLILNNYQNGEINAKNLEKGVVFTISFDIDEAA